MTIRAGTGRYEGFDNRALQAAVDDAAAAGGGVVEVPSGTYRMRDSLHLRSGVRVIGEAGTVLLKVPSIQVPILDSLGYGHYELTVTEPAKLEDGDGVYIADDDADCFYRTVATVTGRSDGILFIDRMLKHDYEPAKHGCVTTLFSIVSGVEVTDVAVEGLTIDGNVEESRSLDGCNGGGIYLLLSQRARIENVEIRRFKGDAVSFQQCADVVVRRSNLHDNAGTGIHPGSGSVRYLLQGNNVRSNGGRGIFYCLRTTHSICEDNTIESNGRAGISVGERDTNHLIRRNVVSSNRGPGLDFRGVTAHGGDRVRVEENRFHANCVSGPESSARAEVHIPAGVEDISLSGNVFEPGGGAALRVEGGARRVSFYHNTVDSRPQAPGDVAGDATPVSLRAPDVLPPVGPAALPPDGARHLGFGTLSPWEDRGPAVTSK